MSAPIDSKVGFGDGGVSSFYMWENPVPNTPGRLLRQEPLPSQLILASAAKGLRILYASTDGVDSKTITTVSGAIFIPKGRQPQRGWPVIAWAHGTAGIADVCAPSWRGRSQRDSEYLNKWLDQGYAVVATDYQGLGTPGGHPYLAVKPEGYSVLDAVRAALGSFPELANSVVLVGQSQGAHAVLSAALLAGQYAPDINLKATVATGVPGMSPFLPDSGAPRIPTPRLTGGNFPAYLLLMALAEQVMLPGSDVSAIIADRAQAATEAAKAGCLAELGTAF